MSGKPEDILPDDESEVLETPDDSAEESDIVEYKFRVSKNLTRRIDQYLTDRVAYLSRAGVQRLIDEGLVKVNGRSTKAIYHPRTGDMVEMVAPPEPVSELIPEPIPLDIVYEDEHFLAINKQADLMVHPARGSWTGTLVNGLVYYGQQVVAPSTATGGRAFSTASTATPPASCWSPRATKPTGDWRGSSRTARSRRPTSPSSTASRSCSAT